METQRIDEQPQEYQRRPDAPGEVPHPWRRGPWLLALGVVFAFSAALSAALVPGLASGAWVQRGPVSDDAYYYLVVARNLAQGRGVTYDGRAVNGFQPLYLAPCVLTGELVGWSESATPALLTALNWLLYNVAGLWLVMALVRRALAERPGAMRDAAAWIAGILWLLNPFAQRQVLNGLETSLALLAWVLVAWVLAARWDRLGELRSGLAAGAALGFAFLARNDTGVLAAVFGVLALAPALRDVSSRGARIRAVAVAAAVTLAFALPWLAYNQVTFGALMPESGRAEGPGGILDRGRAEQLVNVVEALVKNVLAVPVPLLRLPLPRPGKVLLGLAVLAGVGGAGAWAWRRSPAAMRRTLALLGASTAVLGVVYAGFFGAPWNAIRWLAPASVAGVVLTATVLGALWHRGDARGRGAVLLWLLIVLAGRLQTFHHDRQNARPSYTYPLVAHARRVARGERIGSFQSGLLAWAVPDVANLDGKLNPAALRAILGGTFPRYLARSDVAVVIDYRGSYAGFLEDPEVRATFERIDGPEDIVTLRRRAAAPR